MACDGIRAYLAVASGKLQRDVGPTHHSKTLLRKT